jgi:DNA-binding MarR family transcriptional regulator
MLGAFCLTVSDKVQETVSESLGMAASFPAAIVQIGLFSANLTKLQSALALTQSATTRLVQKLEEQGLVEKAKSITDSRQNQLRLTGHGVQHMQLVLQRRHAVLNRAVETLTEDEMLQLGKILTKLLVHTVQDRETSDSCCRLCDVSVCPQETCPAEPDARRE